GARMPQPTAAAQNLVDQDPDIVTIQELESLSGKIIHKELDSAFTHARVVDTIGVWSKWPMSEPEEVDLGLQWPRAFATTISTDHGDIRFYAVHMPSVRPGHESMRNAALRRLSTLLKTDSADHLIVAGHFNPASTDGNLSTLVPQLEDSREQARGGFGFTWPARFPVTRLDHVLYRGFDASFDEVLERGSSDHRAVLAGLALEYAPGRCGSRAASIGALTGRLGGGTVGPRLELVGDLGASERIAGLGVGGRTGEDHADDIAVRVEQRSARVAFADDAAHRIDLADDRVRIVDVEAAGADGLPHPCR